MKKTILSLLPFLLMACDSDDEEKTGPVSAPAPVFENTIRLNQMEDGQRNHYLHYTANCNDPAGSFTYTGDTLVVTIKNTSEGLAFYEEFTAFSATMSELSSSETRVIQEDGYFLIPERELSYLFFFYGNDTVHLTKPEDLNLQQGSCFIEYENGDPFIGEEIGFLPEFEYQNIRYENNRIVSCVPPLIDLDAYLVYNESELRISQTLANDFSNVFIDGYTLLE
jgi:hypothetical protein